MNRRTLTDRVELSDQPTSEEIAGLPTEGFSGLVNLRRENEPDQLYHPVHEGELARQTGLDYLHIGVGGAPLGHSDIASVADFLETHRDGKVLIHCKLGSRAAAIGLLVLARLEGWPASEVLERGRAIGLQLPPNLQKLAEDYLADLPREPA